MTAARKSVVKHSENRRKALYTLQDARLVSVLALGLHPTTWRLSDRHGSSMLVGEVSLADAELLEIYNKRL